jgi:hypothetical protein
VLGFVDVGYARTVSPLLELVAEHDLLPCSSWERW